MMSRFMLFASSAIVTLILLATKAYAATPTFNNLTQAEFNKIMREFSANSSWHSVTPPSSMGNIFGLELGVVAGTTNTPDIDAIVKQTAPGTDVKMIPHASLLGVVSIPFGITAEVMMLPKFDISGLTYQQYGGALKWTTGLMVLPVNLAVRGFMTKSELTFKQTVSSVDTTITQDGSVSGLQLMVSPKLIPIIEPYAGIGYVSATSKMTAVGSSSIFGFTSAQSAEFKPTSTQLILGADVRLLLIGFGFEYERSFETESLTAKFSLKF
jgi:hypothetical protein